MNSFSIMYLAELKKIFSKKSVWIAMAIGILLVLFMGFTNLSAEGHLSYVKDSRETLTNYDGREIDGNFIIDFQTEVNAEIAANPERYDKLMAYDPGTAFMNAADSIGKKSLYDFLYNTVREKEKIPTVTVEEFYEILKKDIVDDATSFGSTEDEINKWLEKYDSTEKPIKYYYCLGYSNILDIMFFIGWVMFLNISIALSGVFSDEKTYKTDAIILSTKQGRKPLCLVKIAAGISAALIECVVLFGFTFGLLFTFFGFGGGKGAIQLLIPSSPWNITIFQMFLIYVGLAMVTAIMYALTNMFFSNLTHSSVATLAIHTAILILGLFEFPNTGGLESISRLWKLRPTMSLHYGTFCNTYLYGGMNAPVASFLIFGAVILVLIALIIGMYKNSQVESR